MTTRDAFLAAVAEAPEDDAPRLVFADWLEENGQPERAELIRLQCRLAATDRYDAARRPLARRERELLDRFGKRWQHEDGLWRWSSLSPDNYEPRSIFRRGFVEFGRFASPEE